MSSTDKAYTPALGYAFLTPVYDLVVGLLTRERTWRSKLVALVDPSEKDRILDVGCGTGSLALRLNALGATVIGLDPDPKVLEVAATKATNCGAHINWIPGFLDATTTTSIGPVNKIVSSLVFHQTPLAEKSRILATIRGLLEPDGKLFIADYGQQRTWAMRLLFRCTVQVFDGVRDTQPNADGQLPRLIREAGFEDVLEVETVATPTGSISLYTASPGGRGPAF